MSKLKVALVQSQLIWENPQANRSLLEEKIKAMPTDVDLVILPEMFTTGFTMNPQNIDPSEGKITVEWMQNLAAEKNTAIMGSLAIQENSKYYNRLFFVFPTGAVATYNKKHTFTLAGEDKVYKAGKDRLVLTYKGFKLCPLVCYDLRFPVWARNTEDYDIIVYVANWPKPRIEAWDTLLKARAIENMAYCIGTNRIGLDGLDYEYSGHSGVYDVLGKQIAYSEVEEILFAILDKDHIKTNREKLKFLDDRDGFSLK